MIPGTIGLIVALALGIFGAPLPSDAQQPTKVPRVGVLWPVSDDPTLESVLVLADKIIE